MKEILLTQGYIALIDDEDYELVSQYKWRVQKVRTGYYAVRNSSRVNGKQKRIYLHRFILSPESGFEIDHINHNGLDNRRENLRVCTRSENQSNRIATKKTSKYKGVSWNSRYKKWKAVLMHNKKSYFLGYFSDELAAAIAYNNKANSVQGEFSLADGLDFTDGK